MPGSKPSCSAPLLDVLVHKVHQHLGMDFSAPRRDELLRRLQLLAVEQQVSDPAAWLQALAFTEWDAALIQSLVPAFSVGETYFRRDPETFDWLAQHHLAGVLARRRQSGQRSLRLWSAGCCTGEEAYSLLFLLDELLGEEHGSWTVELVASDISAQFLARAELALYGSNAFRRNESAFRQRYFQAEGRQWQVRPAWRGRIRFRQFNLIDEGQDCLLAEADLILCRNVLMYFSPTRAAAVVKRLLGCLNDEGLLLLGAVEAGIATQAGLTGSWAGCNYALNRHAERATAAAPPMAALTTVVSQAEPAPHSTRHKREEAPAPVQPVARQVVPAEEHWQQAQQALAAGLYPAARAALLAYLACAGLSRGQQHQACLLAARSWADQQCLDEARDWLQRALQLQADSVPAYWLQAQLAQHSGDDAAALQALHKALYLQPEFILGYFLQARLLVAQGRTQAAAKALRVCQQLLLQQSGDSLVPLGDGMSCGQLLLVCQQLQEVAPPCPSR